MCASLEPGSRRTAFADDARANMCMRQIIANGVLPSLLRSAGCERVYVITTDRELLCRCEAAASAAGSSKRRLRFIGAAKLVSLLMANREGLGEEELIIGAEADPVGHAFARCDGDLRRWVLSRRKLRRHERLRSPQDGLGASFAEKTWHRVVLAEKLRRLLHCHATAVEPPSACIRAVAEALNQPRKGAARSASVRETLLNDVRLDRRQRAMLLRLGAALLEGLGALPSAAAIAEAAEAADAPAVAGRRRPTRRARRQHEGERREDNLPGDTPALDAEGAQEQHLGAISRWLDDALEEVTPVEEVSLLIAKVHAHN